VLRLEDASKSFGGRALFEGASLHVRAEDRIGLVGRNGAGKTTLLRMLAGMDPPDSGTVVLRRGARIGYLRQEVSAVSERTCSRRRRPRSSRARWSGIAWREDRARPRARARRAASRATIRRFERAGGFSADASCARRWSGSGSVPKWERPLVSSGAG
jgi:ATP-binding cassette subfamily F protein 3